MNAQPKKTCVLSGPLAEAVERLIGEGKVRDLDEVVQLGLGVALEPDDTAFNDWVRSEVVPVLDRMERDPASRIAAARVRAQMRSYAAKRLAEG